jgi:hypothetical protein
MSQTEWSPREWSRWDASDMDGQTREGEASGDEAESSGATWTGSAKGVFSGRKHYKPRQSVVASSVNGADGVSHIESKATREAARECGQRVSFNGAGAIGWALFIVI